VRIASTIAVLAALTVGSTAALAATAQREDGGMLADGRRAETVTLRNARGISARVLAYGATLQSLVLPDRKGASADIALGHDTATQYEAKQDFFGITVGRFANRIARGTFVLDGVTYRVPLNDGTNSLHGGGKGLDRQLWTVRSVTSGKTAAGVWVLDKGRTATPELVARAEDPVSGRTMEVLSTEPGLQMYTGNFLDGTNPGKGGCLYRMGDGFVLEPQVFPDTPNRPQFGFARVDPGKPYRHVMVLRAAGAK
jgi:galactose mutarotase-like enzyme